MNIVYNRADLFLKSNDLKYQHCLFMIVSFINVVKNSFILKTDNCVGIVLFILSNTSNLLNKVHFRFLEFLNLNFIHRI